VAEFSQFALCFHQSFCAPLNRAESTLHENTGPNSVSIGKKSFGFLNAGEGNQMTAFSSLLPIGHLLSPKSATG
jgi:hypothetical protein